MGWPPAVALGPWWVNAESDSMHLRYLLAALCLLCHSAVHAVELDVQIEGVEGEVLDNVRAFLDISEETDDPEVLETRVRRLHARAPQQIRRSLQPFGHYKAEVQSSLIREDGKLIARYQIDPGPPVQVANLDVRISGEGGDNPALKDAVARIPVQPNRALRHAEYESAKQMLQRRARELGYLDAQLTEHAVRVELRPYRALVTIHMETGPRYTFGPVIFSQTEHRLNDELLVRYVPFEQGDYFSPAKLIELHSVLTDTGFFSRVEVTPRRERAADTEVPVEVGLVPRKRRRYAVGVGYGTDTGARVSLGYWRLLNRRGHTGSAQIRLSERLSSATLAYDIPLQDPATEALTIEGGFKDEETESRISRTWQLAARRSGTRGTWREVAGLHYELEDFELGAAGRETQLVYPLVSWTRTRADDLIHPNRGTRLRLDLLGASEALFSDVSFLQAQAAGKWVRSLGERHRLLARLDIGATWTESVEALPASKRFFAGGDQSVRGYGFEELGPRNDRGEVVGGQYLLVGSVEYERQLKGKWSGALFYDAGNAANGLDVDLAEGAGFGVRWRSPIGPVRVDFAWAISEPGTPFRLHLVIGPDL